MMVVTTRWASARVAQRVVFMDKGEIVGRSPPDFLRVRAAARGVCAEDPQH